MPLTTYKPFRKRCNTKMYGSQRLTRSYLYGIRPNVQRDLSFVNWKKDELVKEINRERLSVETMSEYRSAWEDFLLDHKGATEYPSVVERKKYSTFVNRYFRMTENDPM
eukprot:TRINITY_DN4561_c2_g1_i2.p1 TRINITY_DN4561_c2_g1~~TRINITY_DN4561_c2_g1_i2.p1  ORF type:complete len:109 (+),score=10.73 TRINITY_DN4561_c2_g1_i2:303-629(+)